MATFDISSYGNVSLPSVKFCIRSLAVTWPGNIDSQHCVSTEGPVQNRSIVLIYLTSVNVFRVSSCRTTKLEMPYLFNKSSLEYGEMTWLITCEHIVLYMWKFLAVWKHLCQQDTRAITRTKNEITIYCLHCPLSFTYDNLLPGDGGRGIGLLMSNWWTGFSSRLATSLTRRLATLCTVQVSVVPDFKDSVILVYPDGSRICCSLFLMSSMLLFSCHVQIQATYTHIQEINHLFTEWTSCHFIMWILCHAQPEALITYLPTKVQNKVPLCLAH